MIVLRSKNYSVRPYAKKLIKESNEMLAKGGNKWEIARTLNRAKERYMKESSRVNSLNPVKLIKRSKDSEDSGLALSAQIGKVINNR